MARTQSGGTAFLIAIALSASAIAPSVSTAQATGRLTGRVTIAGTGTPLAGITVSVPGVRSAVTNDAGQYVLGGPQRGCRLGAVPLDRVCAANGVFFADEWRDEDR